MLKYAAELIVDVDCESNAFDVGEADLEATLAAPVDDRTELVTTDDDGIV